MPVRIRVLSDLHLPSTAHKLHDLTDVDVLVLAGDITGSRPGELRQFEELLRQTNGVKTFFVCGNHEFYYSTLNGAAWDIAAVIAKFPNVTFLDDTSEVYSGLTFAGSTLFTDFNLYGTPDRCKAAAARNISDFRFIFTEDVSGRVTPDDYVNMHAKAVAFLRETVDKSENPVVIITHFTPSRKSIAPQWAQSPVNSFFCSDVTHLMSLKVPLWIHGHTHSSMDYIHDSTRIVCNPFGYNKYENVSFNPSLTIEV